MPQLMIGQKILISQSNLWHSNGRRVLSVILFGFTFLAPINPRAAAQVIQQLLTYPQLGVPLDEFAPRDVRRVIVGDYELRYELTETTTYIRTFGRIDR
jgi:ParE-like toxin of type II ParDE toxin-antitoxin system